VELDMCVPSTTLGAFMLRWMLCFEMRDEDTLWLLKAAPRRLYPNASQAVVSSEEGDGGAYIMVEAASTRFGDVSFTVDSVADGIPTDRSEDERATGALKMRVSVSLALHGRGSQAKGGGGGGGPLTIVIRLRDPDGTRRVQGAAIDGGGPEVALGRVNSTAETVSVTVGAKARGGAGAASTNFTLVATLE
jgi:hypothetical protein